MSSHDRSAVSIADEVWIATALLHREHPDSADFSLQEIAARLRREGVASEVRAGVQPHISQHCVANRPPNPATLRMLLETGKSRRRLFRPGDPFDAGRAAGRTHPKREDVPAEYRPLLDWYEKEWAPESTTDPLLDLARRQKDVWHEVDADRYVRELREGWS